MNKKFLSTGKIANNEKGALLLSVIVTIVIFAVLGAAILSIISTSTFTQIFGNYATKAYYMAESGFRYATMNIMTISIGGDDCLKCHSSHGTETIRYSAGYGRLPDDTIKVHGKSYNNKDLLDGGSFEVALTPFWFKFRAESGDWNKTDKKLTVHAVASSNLAPEVRCDFPEAFKTIDKGGLYIDGQYIKYTEIDATGFEGGTLIFTGVDPDDISLPEDGVLIDVFLACRVEGNQILSKNGELLINNVAGELLAFPNTESVIKININGVIKLITYDGIEDVNEDIGKLIGLGDVDELDPVVAGLGVEADNIVSLSKTLKITSTGRYPDADADAAEKTLEYYRWVGKPLTVPIVYNTAEPDEGKLLAGGNFHWVSDDGEDNDAKGHNVFVVSGKDVAITGLDFPPNEAPGQTKGTLRSCGDCHKSLIKDCKGCHRDPHANDGDGAKFVNTAEQGWYRFLSGHREGEGYGVIGIEHEKWNYDAISILHNEYLGHVRDDDDCGFAFGDGGYTTTAFCSGCHGEFVNQLSDDDQWIRHPSDRVIPDTPDSEYAAAFGGVYDIYVPVARPGLDGSWTEFQYQTVTPGNDMVMCLSCHHAHGSQYPDMLRWKYDDMIVGNTEAAGKGCFQCHTKKIEKREDIPIEDGQHCNECHTMHNSQNNQPMALDGSGPYKYLLRKDPDGLDPLTRPHK